MDVLIIEDGTCLNVSYSNLTRGKISNPFFKSVYKVGFIGIGKYVSRINGLDTKDYNTWNHMMQRCYSPNENQITYKGCTICPEWHNFQNFAKWFEENYIEGFHLDKDILVKGNKVYSPETCCFVPVEINSLVKNFNRRNGKSGVQKQKKFISKITKNGKTIYLGSFKTEDEAHNRYIVERKIHVKSLADVYKNKITENCYIALLNYEL